MKIRKKRKDTEIERLEKENKELRIQIRSLLKQVKKYNHHVSNTIEEFFEETHVSISCPECAKGKLKIVTIANRQFERCNICEYRGKTKKLK